MNILLLLSLALTAILVVLSYRKKRDRSDLAARVRDLGGEVVELKRVRQGHPFPDTGRGWWAWQIRWKGDGGERTAFALTTRAGIKEWRD